MMDVFEGSGELANGPLTKFDIAQTHAIYQNLAQSMNHEQMCHNQGCGQYPLTSYLLNLVTN